MIFMMYTGWVANKGLLLFSHAKSNSSNCLLLKWAVTALCLYRTVLLPPIHITDLQSQTPVSAYLESIKQLLSARRNRPHPLSACLWKLKSPSHLSYAHLRCSVVFCIYVLCWHEQVVLQCTSAKFPALPAPRAFTRGPTTMNDWHRNIAPPLTNDTVLTHLAPCRKLDALYTAGEQIVTGVWPIIPDNISFRW